MCIFIASIERSRNANVQRAKGITGEEREEKKKDIRHCSFVAEIEWFCSSVHTASFHELNHKCIIALVNFGIVPTGNNGCNEKRRREREKKREANDQKSTIGK